MRKVEFTKMQGIGNDFVVVNCLHDNLDSVDFSKLAVRVCDRDFGVGGDGLILVLPSQPADYRMQIFNSDGSEAEMCGNGVRCFAKYLHDRGMAAGLVNVETPAGIMRIELEAKEGRAEAATVNMGAPRLDAVDIPVSGFSGQVVLQPLEVDGQRFDITCVSTGNPHCVIFVDSAAAVLLEDIGPKIETHPAFPRKTNVEFVEVVSPDELIMRVWERAAGLTLACGTGACASVVAGVLAGKSDRCATVHLPGGDLLIDWREDGNVYMTGPAEEVFRGTFRI